MSVIRNTLNFFPEQADKRTIHLPLMGSPWPSLIIIVLYVKFSIHWGPRWMKNRRAFQIDRIVQIFDIFQILANAYIFHQGIVNAWLFYSWKCEPVDYSWDPKPAAVAKACYWYYIVKITDLLDTVFFILRKKQSQVTFLHVYHHATMVFIGWVGVRFFAGGHGTLIGLFNTFVHVIMYTHYLVMSLKIWKPWWKQHVTQIQILQFVILLYHNIQLWFREDCGFPKWLSIFWIPQDLLFLWMFSKFYYYAYIKPPKQKNGDSVDLNDKKN